jgi:hypothetical protein
MNRGKAMNGITRADIMDKIPNLKRGSFRNYLLLAGIKPIVNGEIIKRSGVAKTYPRDSIEKIKKAMSGGK